MTAHRAAFDLFKLSEMADPGDAESIVADRNPCSVPLVSAGAETRTLARPTRAGTLLNLYMRTDGGDITLTVTGGYDETGNTTFTFSDAGQFLFLVSCYDGTNYYWRKVADYLSAEAGTGSLAIADDGVLSLGGVARVSWDTTDANANALFLQLPAGGSVDVPVLAVGQSIESVDLGLFNGLVDPNIALMGVGAVATGPAIQFRKARGTAASPTVVTSGDDMGSIDFYGAVAAGEYVRGARILAEMTGTVATTRGPGVLSFYTATDAAPSVLTLALQITAAQAIEVPVGPVNVGVAGTTTGVINLDGATSGTVSVTVAAAAGTWTMTLPPDDGEAGEQLQTDGSGVTTWEAAGSMRVVKNLIAPLNDKAPLALERVLDAKVYAFRYKEGGRPTTGDYQTVYHGVLAEEYPQVMHHGGRIFNPVSAFGELVLAIQAIAARLTSLEKATEYGAKGTPDAGDRLGQ